MKSLLASLNGAEAGGLVNCYKTGYSIVYSNTWNSVTWLLLNRPLVPREVSCTCARMAQA